MWYKINGGQVELHVLAKPNAKRSAVTGVSEAGLGIALHARPQEGAANDELVAFLAELFSLPKSKIILKRGQSSRHKTIILPLTAKVQAFLDQQEK